jgi:hypothetical protein
LISKLVQPLCITCIVGVLGLGAGQRHAQYCRYIFFAQLLWIHFHIETKKQKWKCFVCQDTVS